jgi:hypothetical protein
VDCSPNGVVKSSDVMIRPILDVEAPPFLH